MATDLLLFKMYVNYPEQPHLRVISAESRLLRLYFMKIKE